MAVALSCSDVVNRLFSGSDSDGDSADSDEFSSSDDDSDSESEDATSTQSQPMQRTTTSTGVWSEVANIAHDKVPSPIVFSGPSQGPTFPAGGLEPLELYQKFITNDILQFIVDETNRYASESIQAARTSNSLTPSSRKNAWTPVTVPEIKAFIAIIYNMGLIDLPRISDYWKTTWESQVPFFGKVMPRNCFQNILSFLHVSRTPSGNSPKKIDKVKMFLDLLLPKFPELYNPSENLSIDETMISYRGRFSSIQYMPQKPTKWGIKVYSIADSLNGYLLGGVVYTGSETYIPNTRYSSLPKTTQLVMQLVEPYFHKGYHLFTDCFYTSVDLAIALSDHDTRFTGTVNNTRKKLPASIRGTGRNKLKLPEKACKVYRQNNLMVTAWHPEKKKTNIYLLSTACTAKPTIISRRGRSSVTKPAVVHQYNQCMNGVDICDQKAVYYSYNRKSVKWWKKVFFWSLEVALINSFCMYKQTFPNATQLDFRRCIVNSLTREHLSNQTTASVPAHRRLFPPDQSNVTSERLDQRKHFLDKRTEQRQCQVCSHNNRRHRTLFFCKTCSSNPALCPLKCFEDYHTLENI